WIWRIDVERKEVLQSSPAEYAASDVRLEIPPIVLRQALRMNMFAHVGISKRIRYCAAKDAMPLLNLFTQLPNFEEYELFPFSKNLTWRSIRAWTRRWREVLGYIQLLWIMRNRRI